MNTPLRTTIEHMFAMLEAKDIQALMNCFAEDATVIDPHYPRPHMSGKREIAAGTTWGFKTIKSFGFTIVNCFESPDGLSGAVEVATHHVLPNGQKLNFPQAFVIETRNGQVTRLQAYEPYGPGGIVGLFLGVTRLRNRLTGKG